MEGHGVSEGVQEGGVGVGEGGAKLALEEKQLVDEVGQEGRLVEQQGERGANLDL